MGRRTTLTMLPDAAYGVGVTRLGRAFRAPATTVVNPATGVAQPVDGYRNRNVANSTPFRIVGGAASVRILPANPRRSGMFLQNKDPSASLYFSFGVAASLDSPFLSPKQYLLLDFTCPASELYVFAAANVVLSVTDMTRQA